MNGGMDATEDFDAIHSTAAKKLLEEYVIGTVDGPDALSQDSVVQVLFNAIEVRRGRIGQWIVVPAALLSKDLQYGQHDSPSRCRSH